MEVVIMVISKVNIFNFFIKMQIIKKNKKKNNIPLKNVAMFLMKQPINLSFFLAVPELIISTFFIYTPIFLLCFSAAVWNFHLIKFVLACVLSLFSASEFTVTPTVIGIVILIFFNMNYLLCFPFEISAWWVFVLFLWLSSCLSLGYSTLNGGLQTFWMSCDNLKCNKSQLLLPVFCSSNKQHRRCFKFNWILRKDINEVDLLLLRWSVCVISVYRGETCGGSLVKPSAQFVHARGFSWKWPASAPRRAGTRRLLGQPWNGYWAVDCVCSIWLIPAQNMTKSKASEGRADRSTVAYVRRRVCVKKANGWGMNGGSAFLNECYVLLSMCLPCMPPPLFLTLFTSFLSIFHNYFSPHPPPLHTCPPCTRPLRVWMETEK